MKDKVETGPNYSFDIATILAQKRLQDRPIERYLKADVVDGNKTGSYGLFMVEKMM